MPETPKPASGIRSFRDLVVWQEATTLAHRALAVADRLPPGYAFVADQLRRSATSVPLNIAEGNGKPTRPDYLRFLGNARGSLNEVDATVELLCGSTLAPAGEVNALRDQVARVGRLLSALIRSLRR